MPSETKIPCVVFDIDGTLAIGTHRAHLLNHEPKKWEEYFSLLHLDTLNHSVAAICRALSIQYDIVYCTGRPSTYAKTTQNWLRSYNLPHGPIYYREANDRRDDSISKPEMLKKIENHGYEIIMIFDDRKRVVMAARGAGYTVAQVADGDF